MIDGMIAALSMRDRTGVPWDERLNLKQEGAQLSLGFHLQAKEAKMLIHQLAHEIEAHTRDPKAGQ